MSDRRLIAGAMSGTSADGVDVAIVRIGGRGHAMTAELLRHGCRPYDADLRRRLFSVRASGHVELAELARLGREISLTYAAAVNETLAAANLRAEDLAAVAAHGQTLFHHPPDTIQWLDPALLAAEVGGAVVSDFRRADCAAGGQGAPLVPFADYILFHSDRKNRAVVNIGGIANVTGLAAGAGPQQVWAMDTGPGNCISDELMRRADPHGPGVDLDGQRASRGKVHIPLADSVGRHPYFARPAPKSTDAPAMIAIYDSARQNVGPLSLEDELATACWITARQIVAPLGPHLDEVILSGGGTMNLTTMSFLRQMLGRIEILGTERFGVPSAAKEAMAFALLAAATLDGEPSNMPAATGARRPMVLGSLTPAPVQFARG